LKIIFILLISLSCLAKDLFFEIHFDSTQGLFERMLSVKKANYFCEVYIYQNKYKVVVKGNEENEIIKRYLAKTCEDKLKIVDQTTLESLLANYDFLESKEDWKVYVDKTGVAQINEIWIKENKKEISLIEKRSIGTSRYVYSLKDDRITKLSMKVYEGLQSIESEHEIRYQKIKNSYLPTEMQSSFVQKLSKRDIGDFERKFDEKTFFKNYKVDQNVALKFFSKSN
jgi:hypothetical protein